MIFVEISLLLEKSLRGVETNVMNCDIVISEFELKSSYYVHFQTNTFGKYVKTFIPPTLS